MLPPWNSGWCKPPLLGALLLSFIVVFLSFSLLTFSLENMVHSSGCCDLKCETKFTALYLLRLKTWTLHTYYTQQTLYPLTQNRNSMCRWSPHGSQSINTWHKKCLTNELYAWSGRSATIYGATAVLMTLILALTRKTRWQWSHNKMNITSCVETCFSTCVDNIEYWFNCQLLSIIYC